MELESLLARVAQLEKDLAECRAKVFFLEAVNAQRPTVYQPQPVVPTPTNSNFFSGDPLGFGDEGDAGEETPGPERRVSPWAFRLRPKTYTEEATEEVLKERETANPHLDRLTEEMFDGNP